MELLELKNLVGNTPLGQIGKNSPINLALKSGEVGVFLVGKESSQLWRLLLGKGEVIEGSINFINDFNQNPESISWRKNIGFAHRDKGLISNLTLLENIELPASYHNFPGENAKTVLNEIGIKESNWSKRPSDVGWKTRKRALLARSVVLNPKILILDDPTELYPYTDYPELYSWIQKQKDKGTGILIGTENTPFGLAVADWVLDPATYKQHYDFNELLNPDWIKTAEDLKRIMQEQHGSII